MRKVTKTLTGDQYLVTHPVGTHCAGTRIDRFLMDRYPYRSRERLKKSIDSGAITVVRKGKHQQNMGRLKPSFVLHSGDTVQLLSTRRPEPDVNFNYKILYEDDHIIAVDKPPNLPVHPAGRFFFNTLLVHLKTSGFTANKANEKKFFLCHRIDKDTSGVLLIAKTSAICAALTEQFVNRETEKYYLAIVRDKPTQSEFTVDVPISKMEGSAIGLKVHPNPVENGGYPSLTQYSVLETRTGKPLGATESGVFSLLACYPKTGRQHQIRVHAAHAGHPLVGDKIYGLNDEDALALIDGHRQSVDQKAKADLEDDTSISTEEFASADGDDDNTEMETTLEAYERLKEKLLLPRHALHAAGLKFTHPITKEVMTIKSELPDDMKEFFESLTGVP